MVAAPRLSARTSSRTGQLFKGHGHRYYSHLPGRGFVCRLPLNRYRSIVEILLFMFVGGRRNAADVAMRAFEVIDLRPRLDVSVERSDGVEPSHI